MAIHQVLDSKNPGVWALQYGYIQMADMLRNLHRLGEAREGYEKAIAIDEEWVKANPTTAGYRSHLADSVRGLGLVKLAEKDAAGAVADTRKALALYDGLPTRSSEELLETACCHATLAAVGGVEGSGLSAQEGEAEAKQALEILGQAIDKGFRNAYNYRTETAFDTLRSRADFQLLVKKLETPAPIGDTSKQSRDRRKIRFGGPSPE